MENEGGTYLLTMDEDVLALAQLVVDPTDGGLEVRLDVGGTAVEDVEPVAVEGDALFCVSLDGGEPGSVEDLDEGGDVGTAEEDGVEDGGEGAEVECAGAGAGGGGRGGGDDFVHGGAHGLHDLRGQVVEANHVGCWKDGGLGCVLLYIRKELNGPDL